MKNNTNKKAAPATSPIANCGRTSNFVAHRDGRSVKRLSTHLVPAIVLVAIFIPLLIKDLREGVVTLCNNIGNALSTLLTQLCSSIKIIESVEVNIDAVSIIVAGVLLLCLIDLLWWNSRKKKEQKRMEEAENIRYYFYDDIIEFCTKEKRESFRTVNGIVSVKVTPAVNKGFGPSFMTALVALLSFNSKPLWQKKYGFRDVTIVTLGSPSETIVLHDVKDPATLVNNIKLHYPKCNVESFGNGFNL